MLSVSEYKYPIFSSTYPRHTCPLLIGKKSKHSLDIIAGLSLLGPSTTRQISKFILENTPEYSYHNARDKDARTREQIYYNLIHDRLHKKIGRKKLDKKYPGLLAHEYILFVEKIKNEKNKDVATYFLTLKGCFLALGFNFSDKELTKFIKNAAFNHPYFAYLNHVRKEFSISFVKRIFIQPFKNMIRDGKINLNHEIEYYFPNISIGITKMIEREYEKIQRYWESDKPSNDGITQYHKIPLVEKMQKLADIGPASDTSNFKVWVHNLEAEYYSSSRERAIFMVLTDENEPLLVHRVMREVYHTATMGFVF